MPGPFSVNSDSDAGFLVYKTFYFKGRHFCFPGPLANKRYPDMQCNIGVRLKWRALKQHHDHNPNPTSIQLPGYIHTTALPFQHHDQAEIDTVLVGNKYLKAPSPSSSLPVPSRSPTQLQQPLLPSSPPLWHPTRALCIPHEARASPSWWSILSWPCPTQEQHNGISIV